MDVYFDPFIALGQEIIKQSYMKFHIPLVFRLYVLYLSFYFEKVTNFMKKAFVVLLIVFGLTRCDLWELYEVKFIVFVFIQILILITK